MILIINYYNSGNQARQKELDQCLKNNVNNRLIKAIVVFHEEKVKIPERVKIISVKCEHRPGYKELFEYGNKFNGIKIIANTDIYFNDTLLRAESIQDNEVYALCRWEEIDNNLHFYNKLWSQDVWIWKGRVNIKCDFGLGIPGCDNALHYILYTNGYNVKSPSRQIQAIHLHHSGIRSYEASKNVNKYEIKQPFMYLKGFE
jgi:hypothetical protein